MCAESLGSQPTFKYDCYVNGGKTWDTFSVRMSVWSLLERADVEKDADTKCYTWQLSLGHFFLLYYHGN